jgi:D-3-phosphoglycerate dehydrogenase / 2-oxoglutarate reductase
MSQVNGTLSYPKENIKILLLEGIHPSAARNLNKNGFTNIEKHDVAWSEEELIDKTQ